MKKSSANELPSTSLRYRSDLFSIQLWPEENGNTERWHGHMVHLATGHARDFYDWDTFVAGLNELTVHKLAAVAIEASGF